MNKKLEIREFDGNYQELSSIIHKSWPNEHKGYINFTPEYLRYLLDAPDTDKKATLGLYDGSKLVSFLLSRSKQVQIGSKDYSLLLGTLSTSDPDYAGYFPYLQLKKYSINYSLEHSFNLSCGYFDYNISNIDIENYFTRKKKFNGKIVRSFGSHIVTRENKKENCISLRAACTIRKAETGDIEAIREINSEASENLLIRENYRSEKIAYFLNDRAFSKVYLFEKNNRPLGFVIYEDIEYVSGENIDRVGSIKMLCFRQEASFDEKCSFLEHFIIRLQEDNFSYISISDTGGADRDVLKKCGFLLMKFKTMLRQLYLVFFDNQDTNFNTIGDDEYFNLEIV